MKKTLLYLAFGFLFTFSACTEDFDEINENPTALTAKDVSAKFFVTNTQQQFFGPNRYPYWRGPIIHVDRFSGHTAFGYKANWWSDGLGYTYTGGYTGAVYGYMEGYNSTLSSFTNFVKPGGTLENDKFYAIALIMKGLYYQKYADTFGAAPFNEASNPDIVTPKFDSVKTIYEGVIADLDEAIGIIGDASTTGAGPELLGENDLFFNGDMQKWKQLANSLKLKMALRGHGDAGADYSAHVSSALSSGILANDNALMARDTEISTWASAVYGDVWGPFYGGGNWHLGSKLVDHLRNNNDPRLSKYAMPIKGGTFTLERASSGSNMDLFEKHTDFLVDHLIASGADVTDSGVSGNTRTVTVAAGAYVGQPVRMNSKIKPHLHRQFFSEPSTIVVQTKNQGKPIFPQIVMTAAESHFLAAHAALLGIGSDANGHYQTGLRHAMKLWDVPDAEIDAFIASEDMASLNGTMEENLEKIAIQRWIAYFTEGYEAWAVVRDTGYPKLPGMETTALDGDMYEIGDLNGAYPQRMRYGSSAYNTNGDNVNAALSEQGPDLQSTKLFWAK
ncbi:MAG: SusD/RagB family nutrient-binding outer membrane lipoprotein [Cryomorphaceae bacterium]|nr:MAG: SusD/RagB family nutrient-binding outer membrane lipoprotein [Cryomorphaceae bacterium]